MNWQCIPVNWRQKLGFLKSLLVYTPKNFKRWKRLVNAPIHKDGKIRVFYGYDYLATRDEVENGGMVKFQSMLKKYPNTPEGFNVIYLVSSRIPADWRQLLKIAKKRGALILWNQNGVAYPAWHGWGWSFTNYPMKVMLREANNVFYQSQFCQETANRFVEVRQKSSQVLYNPVDIEHFRPSTESAEQPFILVGGTQTHLYKVEIAMRVLAILRERNHDLRLRIAGRLTWSAGAMDEALAIAKALEVEAYIDFMGAYTQREAPEIMQGAKVLIHPKYNDPCPGLVIEAMACAVPIVYSKTGGVAELVSEGAGVGIESAVNYNKDIFPEPEEMANAVETILDQYEAFSTQARAHAVAHFDSRHWVAKHDAVICKYFKGTEYD